MFWTTNNLLRMKQVIAIILLLAALGIPKIVSAQQPAGIHSSGRDFYLAQLSSSLDCPNMIGYQGYYVLISSYYDCTVTINYFNPDGSEVNGGTYQVKQKGGIQVYLDESFINPTNQNGNPINPNGEVAEYTACHIHATRPVSVSYYSAGPNTGALYLALQTGALGKDYVVAALPTNPGEGAANGHHSFNMNCVLDSSSSEFAVLAVHNNTKVTIIPNGLTRMGDTGTSTGSGATGVEHSIHVTLSRGEVYWVKSVLSDPTDDESGSIVQADEPVAVFAGNEDAFHGTNNLSEDQRNLIAQQMIPTDYLRSSDYVNIPFLDPAGLDSGDGSAGDEYKVYAADSQSTALNFAVINSTTSQQTISLPHADIASFGNVEYGTNASANRKIMVEQYDYRAQTTSGPNTAPTMMNVVPLKNFERNFIFQVPDDKSQVHKRRFINVIARKDQFQHIFITHNNGAPAILSALPQAGGSYSIPQHSELEGRRFEIYPGSYYVSGDSAFIIYQYGMLGLDPDNDLGDNDDDDYYFEYAAPAGESFGIDGAGSPRATVDTQCGGWLLHVIDDNPLDQGISSIDLLKDPNGVLKRRPGSDSGYVSQNVDFDPVNFTVNPGDTSVTVKIQVDNPLEDAWVYIWIVNGAGNDTLIYQHYTSPKLSFLSTQAPKDDSMNFINSKAGVDTCTEMVFKNLAGSGEQTFDVSGYSFRNGSQGFRVSGTTPSLPAKLVPGDSIVFDVCFKASQVAHVYIDTLQVQTDCPTPIAQCLGSTQVGQINASDYDFGPVLVGHKKCATVHIWNSGGAPFTLTRQWVLDNFENFTFADSGMLPLVIQPGLSNAINLTFCYTPTNVEFDSTQMHWGSDLSVPYANINKNYSILTGHGVAPQLQWSAPALLFASENARLRRAVLVDSGTYPINVDSIEVIGPDTSEFHIIATESGSPTTAFTLYPVNAISGLTSEWVDIAFSPDTTNLRDRLDTLIAFDADSIHPIVLLDGMIGYSSVGAPQVAQDDPIQLHQIGGLLNVQLPSGFASGARLSIFDELGRVIRTIDETTPISSLDVSNLPNGTYWLRASKGNRTAMEPFVLMK